MHNRRKFLLQSGLATTALMVAKPMKAIAAVTHTFSNYPLHYNSITLLHAGGSSRAAVSAVQRMQGRVPGILLLHDKAPGKELPCSACYENIQETGSAGYRVIEHNNIRVGVITAHAGNAQLDRIDEAAARLKNEQNCAVVVCMSRLGFKNKQSLDDRRLAEGSAHIDLIVGIQAAPTLPFIARNRKKTEVILHYTADANDALEKVKIGFDQHGNRYHLSF